MGFLSCRRLTANSEVLEASSGYLVVQETSSGSGGKTVVWRCWKQGIGIW